MKRKILLTVVALTIILAGCGQSKPTTMEIVPFSSQALSIRGVAPEGWMEVNPGHFAGDEWPFKQLLHEAYPGMTIEIVTATAMLPRLGLDALPEPTGTNESGAFTWDLYTIDIEDPDVGTIMADLAMTETDTGVYVVALATGVDDHDALREAVFIPAVEAFEPIVFDQRDRVTVEELQATDYRGDGPVNYAYFLPMGESGSALHELEGILTVPEFKMFDTVPDDQVLRASLGYFPGFSAEFFTHGDNLVPVQREVLLSPGEKSFWKIILSPGNVWSELGDDGMSRASFPFILVAEDSNETHNGVATFLYDDVQVSSLRFQVAQETAAWRQVDYWGQSSLEYRPDFLEDRETLIAQFEEELSHQTAIRPWSDLEENYDPQLLDTFNGNILPWSLSTSGLILDDTIYLQPCHTRYGPFPHCTSMRHGSFSVMKSMGAAIAMLRLAEKYGEEVFNFKIGDYVEVTAEHDGWEQVTFADALNMATGIGDDVPERAEPNVMLADEEGDEQIFNDFIEVLSAQDKADVCFTAGNYPWDPGEVARYNSCHTFILSMAMDSFLKSMEGADADIWDMVLEEVYRPIGIYHAPIMRTIEPDGSRGIPQFWVGLYPTVDDVAKVAILLRNGGQHQGQQLLHAGKLAEALRQTEVVGLPTGEFNDYGEGAYHMSFWSMPYRSAAGDLYQIPYMSGFGGNRVILNPNGLITFQFADAHIYGFESMVKVADGMDPFIAP
ncbi:MAG TPA: beta-lactamase family protein [Anaerolineae bacterium]|nr:beta-lactamase family protein [Anaerolineae bacterium]